MKTYFVCDNSMQPVFKKGDFITLKKPNNKIDQQLLMVRKNGKNTLCQGKKPQGGKLLGAIDRVFQSV